MRTSRQVAAATLGASRQLWSAEAIAVQSSLSATTWLAPLGGLKTTLMT
jgi:hypothetical protein